jgi:hypothetical protein
MMSLKIGAALEDALKNAEHAARHAMYFFNFMVKLQKSLTS